MPGWMTLGNQLPGARIKNPEVLARYRAAYPDENLTD